MSAFADTSGLYALIVRTDDCHESAVREFRRVADAPRPIWTTSYVLVETETLLQSRIGMAAFRDFEEKVVPLLTVTWVGKELHAKGAARTIREDRRRLGLVDCVSLEFMKSEGLRDVLGADPHFEEAGFRLLLSKRNGR